MFFLFCRYKLEEPQSKIMIRREIIEMTFKSQIFCCLSAKNLMDGTIVSNN